ncbi:MAG: R3H domain-containing nucleic acid-binding protein [Anaerolineales bacterium]|jgi:stage III sporulation protein SpoIIIAA
MATRKKITDDLHVMLGVLPAPIGEALARVNRWDELLEVILDLGRVPTARYLDREVILDEHEVSRDLIDYVVGRIGEFDADNRAGLERTLHRISAIRNRRGHIVGLTCRVGRAVYGTIDIIQDLIESGKSVLLLGRPGIGKTTMLREAARILAEKKRVVIVDTSNEIGGDGDVPHPAVGRARRMQVTKPSLQHEVMIEAVENHNPEVIIIDEIGREQEAEAARTIAERGVQLIGTAHGNTLDNILLNPTLADLVGGIESVTLSDEEARRRGTQKTVLERRAPPTFDLLVEIQDRERLAIHLDVAVSVDAMLRGRPRPPQLRYRDEKEEIHVETAEAPAPPARASRGRAHNPTEPILPWGWATRQPAFPLPSQASGPSLDSLPYSPTPPHMPRAALKAVHVFPYGVARNRLEQAAKSLRVPVVPVNDLGEAQAVATLKAYYRRRQHLIEDAEARGIPIYVLRANTIGQMENFLSDLFGLEDTPAADTALEVAMHETQEAVRTVLDGAKSVDLAPASAYIRRLQHQLARQSNLLSQSYGKEPRRRVRIFRE